MAVKYGRKQKKYTNIVSTVLVAILLCTVFITVVAFFYQNTEEEAYETLHIQTKQIKDDLTLQLLSDRENLATMANFAAKLYSDEENFDLMFASFKPIGLISSIGILTPQDTLITKVGTADLSGRLSFAEEKEKGAYISGRVEDLTRPGISIIRSAVPIKLHDQTVGILYGLIEPEVIGNKYNKMAEELDAQLFVHDKETGSLIIETLAEKHGNIAFLQEREYNEGYSFEAMMQSDKGFTSFKSAYTGENLYVHFSEIEDIDWKIVLARYESQVFAKTHDISQMLLSTFLIMVGIMALFTLYLMRDEKQKSTATKSASDIRKLLLEINQQKNIIMEALKITAVFSKARSAIFFDTDGEEHLYMPQNRTDKFLPDDDKKRFMRTLLRYAAELHEINGASMNCLCIKPNQHLFQTNPDFHAFLKKQQIRQISFVAVVKNDNHISILGVINPKKSRAIQMLLEDIVVCFTIAIYNKKHLNKTEIAATTDGLTGVSNRVAYKKDVADFDMEKSQAFSCVYIDVNELHICNNKKGHAAGDAMLVFIANTLCEVFYGHKIYRMGGDEFLVFTQGATQEAVEKAVVRLKEQLLPRDYHVAVGISYRTQNTDTEEMVREAEVRMYEEKAKYYQEKDRNNADNISAEGYVQITTGMPEIDTMLSVLKENYNGIYRVSLDTDQAHRILMPSYLGYQEHEEHFSVLFTKYVDASVAPEFHRALLSFLNYDAIKMQFAENKIPKITYKKTNNETVTLSVYKLNGEEDSQNDTLWVFARE